LKKIYFIFMFCVSAFPVVAQSADELIQEGNAYYKKGVFQKAVERYDKALAAEPQNVKAKYNKANALFKLDKKVEAAVLYNNLIQQNKDNNTLLAKAWYNKGVVLSGQNNLEESIEAYKNVLRINPNDNDARENLQKALLALKKKKERPKEGKKKKEQQKQQTPKSQSSMSRKEVEQRLQLLQQKEREVQKRIQQEKQKGSPSDKKDW
ncbi:MAG: tetratricopeptide repeat protein, partial [Chitinophagaceae bacterium]|nr:tetratricopeptide repeat protein [Chitinophagaceae bacterium]